MSWRASRSTERSHEKVEPGQFLAKKSRPLIEARIRGLETVDECRDWIEYELEHEPTGEVRKWVVAACNDRISQIE